MKKIYLFVMMLLAAVCYSPASAENIFGEIPGGGRWGYESNTNSLWIGGDSLPDYSYTTYYEGEPLCPDGMESFDVTNAPWAALQGLIKTIVLEPSVTHVGAYAFCGLTEVQFVNIPYRESQGTGLVSIGDHAFHDCTKLSRADFQWIRSIGDYAFAGTDLSYVELPNVRSLGSMCFAYCPKMKRTEVENFVVVNNDVRPSVYINTATKPQMNGYLSNYGSGVGGIEFLVLVPYAQKNDWGYSTSAEGEYRVVFGGDFGLNLSNGLRSYWYIKLGNRLVINGAYSRMPDYSSANAVPWKAERDNINYVYVSQMTHLGAYAFKDFSDLREAYCDLTEMEIGDHAFENCAKMWKGEFEAVTKIGAYAFKGCKKWFVSPSFPKCQEIGTEAFANSEWFGIRLKDIQRISAYAFKSCINLSLTIANCNPPQVDANAFAGIGDPEVWLEIPAGCSSSYLGSPWASMDKHYLPADLPISGPEWSLSEDGELRILSKAVVKNYGTPEMVPWHGYREYVKVVNYSVASGSNNPKGVGDYMFCDMPNLERAYFITDGAKVGKYAFASCPKLTDLGSSLKGVTEIDDAAFSDCSKLQQIVIGDKCTKIGKMVFYEANDITDFYCSATTPPTVSNSTFNGIGGNQSNVTLHVPANSQLKYIQANYWKEFKFEGNAEHGTIVKAGTFFDGYFMLYSDGFLYCVADDGTVNTDQTENELFQIRTQPKEIYVDGEISYIRNAFKGCTNVTSVRLPSTVTKLVQTFLGCTKLTDIEIQNVTYLGVNTFRDCPALRILDLSNVETIDNNCFDNSGIRAIQADRLKAVNKEAFKNCPNLETVNLGNAEIKGDNVFQDCTNLTEFECNGRTLKSGMFSGCTSLETVTLHDHVQVIEGDVFTGTALNTIYYLRARPASLENDDAENIFSGVPAANITLYVPQACVETFSDMYTWRKMNIQPYGDERLKALPQSGFLAHPNDTWTVSEDNILTIESDGEMTEWSSNFDLSFHPLEEWIPYFHTVEVTGETTSTMDNLIPKDRSIASMGVTHIVLGKNIQRVGRSFDKIYYLERVDCYAEEVPEIDDNAFDWTVIFNNMVPLHVSRASGVKNAYKAHNIWKKFQIIADLGEVYKVTLNAAHGYITVAEDVNLNAVPEGTVLHLTAVPLDGYRFEGWENYDPETGLTVNSDVTVKAVFVSLHESIDNIQGCTQAKAQKLLRNGQLLILMPDGKTYTIQGQRTR